MPLFSCGEPADAVAPGDAGQVAQEERADAASLPMVLNGERDLRAVCFGIEIVIADGDDVLAVGFRHDSDDAHLVAMIDIDEILDLRLSPVL